MTTKSYEPNEPIIIADYDETEEEVVIIPSKKKKQQPKVRAEEIKKDIKEQEVINNEQEAKSFISGLLGYISSPEYDKKLVEKAQKSGLDKKTIANSFATRILGKIGDLLCISIDCICDAFSTLVSILAGLLVKGGELICRIAKRLVSLVTFNYTCIK